MAWISGALSVEGAALLDEGRPHDAVEVLRRAVAAGESAAPDLLVRAYLESGHWHCIVDWLGPLVDQGAVRYAGRLGVALIEIGSIERAENALRLALGTGDMAAASDLAILLRDGGRLVEAVSLLADAAEAGDPRAGANLSEVLLEAGRIADATVAAEKYLDESRPDTVVALGDVRVAEGRHDEAAGYYRRGVELGALRGHTAYGTFLLEVCGDAEAAEREYRAGEECREPGWAFTLGRFLVDEGRPDEARDYLQLALEHGDESAQAVLFEIDGEDPYED